jgi:putative transposon-encoded protein
MPKTTSQKKLKPGLVFILCAILFVLCLGISFFIPNPTNFQYIFSRIGIVVGAAGFAGFFPGSITLLYNGFRATGAFAAILLFYFWNPAELFEKNFSLTVYVHGNESKQDMILKNEGEVIIDLNDDRREAKIGERGDAFFRGIPKSFYGQKVFITIQDDEFEIVKKDTSYILSESSIYIEVRRKSQKLFGNVADEKGNPLQSVKISAVGIETFTNTTGDFSLNLPDTLFSPEINILASKTGYENKVLKVKPNLKTEMVMKKIK